MEEIKPKKNMEKLFRWIAIIGFISTIIVLIIVKIQLKDSFDIKHIFIYGGLAVVIFGVVFFLFKIISLFNKSEDKKDEKNPNPITFEEAQSIARKKIAHDFFDYIEYDENFSEGVEEHGQNVKQSIYSLYCKGLYTKQYYFIAFNMHYPNIKMNFAINPTPAEMNFIMKKLPTDPEENPDKEIIERKNPLLGTEERIIKTSKKPDDKKEEEKKEDL